MKINIRGIDYFIEQYHMRDDFPVLVMLHGFMGSVGSFFHLTNALTRVANVILVDLIGHGETESPADPTRYGSEEQVADIIEILNPLKSSSVILHGYSMGGRLALQFAVKHPEVLKGLILESTTAGIAGTEERMQRKKTDRKRAMQILEDKDRFIKEWNRSLMFQNRKPLASDMEEQLEAIQQAQNSIGLQNSLLGFGTGMMSPLHEDLANINIPTLILSGVNDSKFLREGRILSDLIPNNTFVEIDNASHRIHLDNPEAYLARVTEYISGDL